MTQDNYAPTLKERARASIERAYDIEIEQHIHAVIMRLSGDAYYLRKLDEYQKQFERGFIAIVAVREASLKIVDALEF